MREESQVVLAVRQEGMRAEALANLSRRSRRRWAMVRTQITEYGGALRGLYSQSVWKMNDASMHRCIDASMEIRNEHMYSDAISLEIRNEDMYSDALFTKDRE